MNINTHVGSVHITLSDDRLMKNVKQAQRKLNMQIVADCTPLVPFRNGGLRSSVEYPQGIDGGEIMWIMPYAHYIYSNNLYLTSYGSSWAKRGEKKYPTGAPLVYHHPGTTGEWFEVVKRERMKDWEALVRLEVGKP